jgi:hypothetical protein
LVAVLADKEQVRKVSKSLIFLPPGDFIRGASVI